MKNPKLQALVTLTLTMVVLWGLLLWDPFLHLRDVFAKTGPAQEDAQVTVLFTDPTTQEVSNGQRPLGSLRTLEASWCSAQKENRYILTGNSQTFTVLLAPWERPPKEPDHTYPDLLLAQLNSVRPGIRGYRLSAPNISYMEVLWYLKYLILHPCLIPGEFVVQLNYETFRKGGVREGMLELLEDPEFVLAIGEEARSDAPYASTFQKGIDTHESRIAEQNGSEAGAPSTRKTGLAEARGAGNILETSARAALERLSLFNSRGQLKGELLEFLYLARVNLLGITPTTKRSLAGAALTMNVSALERVGELCRRNGIRLVFFNAPQNPKAPLYRTAADQKEYQQIISRLVEEYGSGYFDFEKTIPERMWGVWIDGPDPIHFGDAAHRRLADLMFKQGVIPLGQ